MYIVIYIHIPFHITHPSNPDNPNNPTIYIYPGEEKLSELQLSVEDNAPRNVFNPIRARVMTYLTSCFDQYLASAAFSQLQESMRLSTEVLEKLRESQEILKKIQQEWTSRDI